MSASTRTTDEAPGNRRLRHVPGIAVALAVSFVAGTLWLLRDDGLAAGEERPVDAAAVQAKDAPAAVHAESQDSGQGEPAALSTELIPTGPAARPGPAAAAAVADGIVQGRAVRASDGSPVPSALVIALQGASPGVETELAHARSDANGAFTLATSEPVDGFRVLMKPPRSGSGEELRERTVVPARFEWTEGDPAGGEVSLRLETGWRLDLRVVDEAGKPRAGALVEGGGGAATSDATGACTLLDLPVTAAPLSLRLRSAPSAEAVTRVVEPPESGGLRRDVELILP